MKIKRLALTNVTSYREKTEFAFDDALNILIGPNGGGKSNVQKTLAIVLAKYFIHQYDFRRSDTEAEISSVDLWAKAVLERTLAPYLGNEEADQIIEIELAPDPADIENIRVIGAHLDDFNEQLSYWESPRETYEPEGLLEEIASADSFTYRIKNFELEEPARESGAWGFREYLRTFFIFMRLAARIPKIELTSPVFFFFSERTSKRNVQVTSQQLAEQQYHSGFRSAYQVALGENTDLLQWGTQHFARVYWRSVNQAAKQKDITANELFSRDPDVELLTHYLTELGYEWTFYTDEDSLTYTFVLRRLGSEPWLTADKFSSGEREIVHFLLAMFALNVRDGVVLVDEPELHLHPRWQKIFLGLFRDIADTRNNQFLIATHSPVFVTPDTIDSIIRIYKSPGVASNRIALRDVKLPEKKTLVRMINSQNNERVFFADKVVLVEGVTDRLVFSALLEAVAAQFRNYEAIEIIEVGGKHNFDDYRGLLKALETPSYVVADLDYLLQVGSDSTKELFESNRSKEWKIITGKKSLDGATMMELLREAIEGGDVERLSEFMDFLEHRAIRLKDPLSEEGSRLLDRELARLRDEEIYLLGKGEVEAYLPDGVSDLRSIVECTTDRDWLNHTSDAAARAELVEISCDIVGAAPADIEALKESAQKGELHFPPPLSKRDQAAEKPTEDAA